MGNTWLWPCTAFNLYQMRLAPSVMPSRRRLRDNSTAICIQSAPSLTFCFSTPKLDLIQGGCYIRWCCRGSWLYHLRLAPSKCRLSLGVPVVLRKVYKYASQTVIWFFLHVVLLFWGALQLKSDSIISNYIAELALHANLVKSSGRLWYNGSTR